MIAGMLCLLVASMNPTKGLGPVAAVGIAVGLMVMLTVALGIDYNVFLMTRVHEESTQYGTRPAPSSGLLPPVG